MRRALPLLLVGVLLLANAPTLADAWRGHVFYGYRLDACDATPLGDACDTLFSHLFAYDAWTRTVEAWGSRTSILGFLLQDLWQVAADSRAFNLLDFLLLVWPARLLLPTAPAFTVLHLGIVALAILAGWAFARGLGASRMASVAAASVAGGSGVVIECVMRGQYPQAVLAPILMWFLGLERAVRGGRGAIALCAGGLALSALLYWQNPLILAVGTVAWGLGRVATGEGVRREGVVRVAAGAGIAAVLCMPAAWPVLRAMQGGMDDKLMLVPWGTAYGAQGQHGMAELLDEVSLARMFSPAHGWIVALPLIPALFAGLRSRRDLAWVAVSLVGFVLALGPAPEVGDARVGNPIYLYAYPWVPTFSRMSHPLRYGVLLAVGLTAGTAIGVDRLRVRWPEHALLLVASGLAWLVIVGPWRLRVSPFPEAVATTLAPCDTLVLAVDLDGERPFEDVRRLQGLLWRPVYPAQDRAAGGIATPTPRQRAASDGLRALRDQLLSGARTDLPPGVCVVHDEGLVYPYTEEARAGIVRVLGEPGTVIEVEGLYKPSAATRRLEVFRPSL